MVSVVICTYNRANYLTIALDSLARQSCSGIFYEVIVVDNNSSDDTKEVVSKYLGTFGSLRYIKETNIGLSYARNRGFEEALYEFIAYVDDDCFMPPDWLATLIEDIKGNKGDLFGGPVFPLYLMAEPLWIKEDYFAFSFGGQSRYLEEDEYLFGGNFIIRKKVLEKAGGFDLKFGMSGTEIGYSEETELQKRLRRNHHVRNIYFDANLWVKHLVRPEKMSVLWFIRSFMAKGRSNFLLSERKDHKIGLSRFLGFFSLGWVICKSLILILHGLLFRNRRYYPYFENFMIERMQGHFKRLGFLRSKVFDNP